MTKHDAITALIKAEFAKCGDIEKALDTVVGAGTYKALLADTYQALKA